MRRLRRAPPTNGLSLLKFYSAASTRLTVALLALVTVLPPAIPAIVYAVLMVWLIQRAENTRRSAD